MAMLNLLGLTRFLLLGSLGRWPLVVAVGALPYPLTFLCTDLISELWGERRAGQLVWVGFLLNGWIVLILWLGGVLPGTDGFGGGLGLPDPAATGDLPVFYELRRLTFGGVTASMVAYLAAQFTDVRLFHFWKRLTGGRALWLRNNGSTLISQLVDTSAVVLISHYGAHVLPVDPAAALPPQLLGFIASGYLFKLLVALADTVPFILLVGWLRPWLGIPEPGEEIAPQA
ncbi:VUT family protein [Synechococcus sp. RSCCF101]|nr:VUT family protein [Synechococcus sp. RSCCF101]